ncbi:hypothetical protein G4B88_005891 [Cannabis sativa]|uniref:Acid phosphatase/vanadium-dependent haloperoxidase-related protein n=1 Tax=Cannabis sativa TaxID=3483 RepID=A0A7J6IBE5_CANSA|nr:hypothetical protein G4B88_005891 [Cannabis sativa]
MKKNNSHGDDFLLPGASIVVHFLVVPDGGRLRKMVVATTNESGDRSGDYRRRAPILKPSRATLAPSKPSRQPRQKLSFQKITGRPPFTALLFLCCVVHHYNPCSLFLSVLIAAGVSAVIGQLSKPFTSVILYGKEFDMKSAIQAKGFPSTHSSAIVAAATCLGLERKHNVCLSARDSRIHCLVQQLFMLALLCMMPSLLQKFDGSWLIYPKALSRFWATEYRRLDSCFWAVECRQLGFFSVIKSHGTYQESCQEHTEELPETEKHVDAKIESVRDEMRQFKEEITAMLGKLLGKQADESGSNQNKEH